MSVNRRWCFYVDWCVYVLLCWDCVDDVLRCWRFYVDWDVDDCACVDADIFDMLIWWLCWDSVDLLMIVLMYWSADLTTVFMCCRWCVRRWWLCLTLLMCYCFNFDVLCWCLCWADMLTSWSVDQCCVDTVLVLM